MDFKTIVLLLASGQGLLLSLALMSQFNKANKSNVFLGIIVFVLSLEVLNDFAVQIRYHSSPSSFPFWILLSYLLLPPAIWMFIRLNLSGDLKIKRVHVLLFLPAIVQMLIETVANVLFRFYEIRINLISYKSWFIFAEVLPVISTVFVMVIYTKFLITAKQRARESDNPVVKKHLNKHLLIYGVLLLLTVLWIIMVFTNIKVFALVEVLLITGIYVLGYIAYINPTIFEVPRSLLKPEKPFTGFDDNEALNKIYNILISEKLFVRTKLSLNDLAIETRLPVRYVSYLVNKYHNTNFNDFVNSYRVKEVIEKINNPAEHHKTLLGLALEAGFNSKSAFNQAFKLHTGKTPSSYLKLKKQVPNHVSGSIG